MKNLVESLSNEQKLKVANGLLKLIDAYGLSTLSKADLEAWIFSLLRQNIDSEKVIDSRDWIRYLKVTPTKLRNMQLLESVKQRPIDLNDKNQWFGLANALKLPNIEIEDKKSGLVRFYIDDAHLKRFIEEFVVDMGSSIDYKENKGQIVLKFSMYLELIINLSKNIGIDEESILKNITNDSDYKKIEDQYNRPEILWEQIKLKLKEKTIDELAGEAIKICSTAIIKVVKNRLLGDR